MGRWQVRKKERPGKPANDVNEKRSHWRGEVNQKMAGEKK